MILNMVSGKILVLLNWKNPIVGMVHIIVNPVVIYASPYGIKFNDLRTFDQKWVTTFESEEFKILLIKCSVKKTYFLNLEAIHPNF